MRRKRDTENTSQRKGWQRYRGRCLVLAVSLFFLTVLFGAPIIVAKTGLRNRLAAWGLRELDGDFQIGSASLSWFSQVELRDVHLTDASGNTLAEVARVRSSKPLLALLANSAQLGHFEMEQPKATIEVRQNGSNLEDALRDLLKAPDDERPSKLQLTIGITDGTIRLKKSKSNDLFEFVNVNAKVSIGGNASLSVVADGATLSGGGDGRFETKLTSTPSDRAGAVDGSATEIAIVTERIPLRLMEFAMLRFGAIARISGDLDAEIKFALAPRQPAILGIRRFDARRFGMEAPQWLGEDRLALDIVSAAGTLALADGTLELDQFNFTSDVAQLEANGTFDTHAVASGNPMAMLVDRNFRIDGKVDVGRLANMLPDVLSVKDDTRVTGGQVHVNAFSRIEADRRRWVATLDTSALTAVSSGRQITWDQPLRITLAALDSAEGPAIETLSCQSDFLTATAKGTLHEGTLTAKGDLDRLSDQLGRFVDLSQVQLAGELSATADWQRQPDRRVRCAGDVVLSSFAVSTAGGETWREDRLTLDANVLVAMGNSGLERLDSGQVTMKAGSDYLEVRLAGSRTMDGPRSPWPVSAVLRGELATWLPRIKPWITLPSIESRGRIDLSANGQLAASQLHVHQANLLLDGLQFTGAGLYVNEPKVVVQGSADWEGQSRKLMLRDVTLTSSTVALRADTAEMRFDDAIELSSMVSFRCDADRLSNWFRDPSANAAEAKLDGHVTGDATIQMRDRLLSAELAAKVHKFAYLKQKLSSSEHVAPVALDAEPWQPLWQESLVAVDAQGNFDLARGTLNLTQAKVAGEGLTLNAKGHFSELTAQCLADVTGHVDYDLATVSKQLQSQLGPNVQFTGRQRGTFSLSGPLRQLRRDAGSAVGGLVPNELTAEAQMGWTAANVYGFAIGQGKVSAVLREGVVECKPIVASVGDGRMNVSPRAFLNRQPATLVIERGKIVEKVPITPEMSRGWLKFVAPMLAGATEVQGRFSIDLAGAQFPLTALAHGNARGALQVHGANFGPGPMGRELLIPAQRIQALLRGQSVNPVTEPQAGGWLQLPQQQVTFHLVDGRIHHENLHIMAGDVAIVTSGNVGMDQTVDMMARVPIRADLVAGNQMLAHLRGQTLQIPVKGSLSRPLVDSRVIANATRQVFRGAAEQALEREVQRGLEQGLQQLFGPSR